MKAGYEKLLVGWTITAVFLAACSQATTVNPSADGSIGQSAPFSTQQQHGGRRHRDVRDSAYSVAYNFEATKDTAIYPVGPLYVASNGNLYGTSLLWYEKASSFYENQGAVYEVTTAGSTFSVQTLYRFNGFNGYYPETGVVRGADGDLYGTTFYGGYDSGYCSGGCGVLFKLTKNGSGVWSEKILHSFGNPSPFSDGVGPSGPPLLLNGYVYGVATFAGCSTGSKITCYGVVYQIKKDGTGYTIIHYFSKLNKYPMGSLVADSNGDLFGTVLAGGGSCDIKAGCGAVYELTPTASGWSYKDIYQFTGVDNDDGANPETGVTLAGGDLYGTTVDGGKSKCSASGGPFAAGCGTVFQLVPSGSGTVTYTENVLYKWGSRLYPSGVIVSGSALYGTTSYGGSCSNSKFPNGCGTLFSVTTGGSYSTLHSFAGPPGDGALPLDGLPGATGSASGSGSGWGMGTPVGPLDAATGASTGGGGVTIDSNGVLWGATEMGGNGDCPASSDVYGCGVIYKNTGFGLGSARKRNR
jgi:uncharacterized repeat protein (TIGR03803 family)